MAQQSAPKVDARHQATVDSGEALVLDVAGFTAMTARKRNKMRRELAAEDDGLIQQLEHTAICLVAGGTQIGTLRHI